MPNSLVKDLLEILEKERLSRGEYRVIVFVRTRALALGLRDCLKDAKELRGLNVETLTGN